MEYLHQNNIIHGRLTPSNILIDENMEPLISDFNFSILLAKTDLLIDSLQKHDLYYYIDPYTLKTGEILAKSDVYSFGIIALQILSGSYQVYDVEYVEDLIKKIKTENLLPIIPQNFPDPIKELLYDCLNEDPLIRPNFKDICEKLLSFIHSLNDIPTEIIDQYIEYLENSNSNTANHINDEIKYNNEPMHDDNKNDPYDQNHNFDNIQYIEESINNDEINNISNLNDNYLRLLDDPYFDIPKINIDEIINQIENEINKIKEFTCDNPEEIEKLNFIQTEGAKERLQKLADYIRVNVPVLLEGPTGTSKTLSAEIVCVALHLELIRFNLSSETKTSDLIGRYVGDENSWAGISMKDGPFYEAFSKGKVLLLDEINLAPPSVLQCIEEALDSGYLSVEIPGRPLHVVEKHPNFRLIATQNPNKGLFANKRQNLGVKFYSRFQVISFPSFSSDELREIGIELAKKFNYTNEDVVKELVDFHKNWSDYREKTDDPQCFTVREIAATVNALGRNENVYDTIMTIYGARYQKKLKEELKDKLSQYQHLNTPPSEYELPNYPGCYVNESLKSAVKSINTSFKNHRHVILTGKAGCGKTQVALWASDDYNNEINRNDDEEMAQSFFCVCTEEIKVADLVGSSSPSGKSDGTTELIVWQDGFLTKAIKQGKCCVLESLDEAPSTVTERLNALLDKKYDNKEQFFEIPESSACPKVPINKNFRILATCNIDKLSKMSPALLNRFDIIVLEDQIDENISQDEFKKLLIALLDNFSSNIKLRSNENQNTSKEEEEDNDFDDLFTIHKGSNNSDDSDQNTNNDEESEVENKTSDDNDSQYSDEENNKNYDNNTKHNDDENTKHNDDDNTKTSDDDNTKTSDNEDDSPFKYPEEIIELICNKLKEKTNISFISKVCKAIIKLFSNFQKNTNISDSEIVDFAFLLLENNKNLEIPKSIEEHLIGMLQQPKKNNDAPFFYSESPTLKSFLAKLMAYSLIEQPVCITGPTGVGKTSSSRAFSMMRPCKSDDLFGFQFHSFHSGTKVSHFYGTKVLADGNIQFHDGTLTTALKKGLVFIADEFNLSSQSVMKSLSLALDQTIGRDVFIPGTGQIIKINPEFFFIACQNELGTIGRNAIPDTIANRFIEIDYPTPDVEDIQNICIDIAKDNMPDANVDTKTKFNDKDEKLARNVGNYMMKLNELRLIEVPPWSLRDITKLFKRIYNEKINDNFIGITPYHHILFYTISALSDNDFKRVKKSIQSTIEISFNLKNKESKDLIECIEAQPEIKEIEDQGHFIMKGNLGLSINKIRKDISTIIEKELPSFWNSIFQVSLADQREPILLMGNSSFKTYLSHNILPSAQIISLNQETTVAQLLGTSAFMIIFEAKMFYIEYICKILQIDSQKINLCKKLQKGTLSKSDIDELIKKGRSSVPDSFRYALDHLSEKLFNNSSNHSKESILSNTVLEFRPGLFFDAILQRQSLILKDLSNLPTIVLERFNELFSGRQNLTLSEDIHNTFVKEDSKELTDFNTTFRIFATCPLNSPTKLSEAVLSRFSVINIPEYQPNEQEVVLKSYIHNNDIFDSENVTILKNFAISFHECFNKQISFPQMIKIIELSSKVNIETIKDNLYQNINAPQDENLNKLNQNHNLGLILYRYLSGLFETNKNRKELIKTIGIKLSELPDNYNKINDRTKSCKMECPLTQNKQDKSDIVLSNMSKLFIKTPSIYEVKTKVAFTPTFNDLLDLIHLSLKIHNPIILEGPPGQGKHTAINFVAEMLNIEVIEIMISQSTKVEDLFGKNVISRKKDGIHVEMVETKLVEVIKGVDNYNKRSLIVLENINNASPAVLNQLVPVFDTNINKILLPNGTTIEKGQFDIIGIFNTQQVSSSKDKLPSSLINSSFYHVVLKPSSAEISEIILTKFENEGFAKDEAIRFTNAFIEARKMFSDEDASMELFTLNDIKKYLLFRSLTKDCFDETTIMQIIFAYRFSTDKMIKKMLDQLQLQRMKFNPIFEYNISQTELYIQLSKSQNQCNESQSNQKTEDQESNDKVKVNFNKILSLPCNNVKDKSIISKIENLSLPQKHCLIFLALSFLSKRTCVVQGDTASGKSYIIRLFAELLGKKLVVFQMNSDTNISMLSGQSILNDAISDDDIEKFKTAFKGLCIDDRISKYFNSKNNIDIDDPSKWNPKKIKNLLDFVISLDSISEEKKQKIDESIKLIKETMNPVNRFHHQQSEFIKAMLDGSWILIDGIESAPSAIVEKISSLCGEKKELNLYEFGADFLYSIDSDKPTNKIHNDFHLFITYNPHSLKEFQMIDQTFLVKSVTFTLPPIDETIENSAQILFGSFINLSYPKELAKQLASRIAFMHDFTKKESNNNSDDFAGDIPYHGRILTFIIKAFALYRKELQNNASCDASKSQNNALCDVSKPICFAINSFYINSCSNKNIIDTFRKNCVDNFKIKPSEDLFNSLQTTDMSLRERNKLSLIRLRNIQKNIILKENNQFSLIDMLDDFARIRISDVSFVQKHVKDTIRIIKDEARNNSNSQPMIKYGTLYTINSIFKKIFSPYNENETIKMEYTFLLLKDNDLRSDKSINLPLSRFDLLINLLQSNLFAQDCSNILGNKEKLKILNQISLILTTKEKRSIANLFKLIESNNSNIEFIDEIFPYFYFNKSELSLIRFWIPLTKALIQNNSTFTVTIDKEKINVHKSSKYDFAIYLVMNEKNNLELSKGSKVKFNHNKDSMDLPQKNDLLIYYMILELSNSKKTKTDEKCIKALFLNAKKTFKKEGDKCPKENQLLSLNNLFNDVTSLINLIWNLIFTLSENDIMNLSKIVNPVESQILLSALKIYQLIDQNNMDLIILWSKWANLLDKKTNKLLKCILNQISGKDNLDSKDEDIDDAISKIVEEMNYLQKSPDKKNIFWDSKEWIEVCKSENYRLVKKKALNENKMKELEIQKKLDDLIQYLNSVKIKDEFNAMRKEIALIISSITEYTEDKYNIAKESVNQFINNINANNYNRENTFINWPTIESFSSNKNGIGKTENIKLFESLIQYSKIKELLTKINKGHNLMSNLMKLSEYPEMNNPRELLLTHLIKNSEEDHSGLTLVDKKGAKYTLEANMISKIYKINKLFIENPKRIFDVVNGYANRKSCDEREVHWIYQIIKDYDPNFSVSIPMFEPNALVFLVVNQNADNQYKPGPLFSSIPQLSKVFLQDQSQNMYANFNNSFRDAAASIAGIVYTTIISKTLESPPKEYDAIKKIIYDQKEAPQENLEIFKRVKFIFELAEHLENWGKNTQLLFNDIFFLSIDWDNLITNDVIMNEYPSLLFWIIKNSSCTKQLQKMYHNFTSNPMEIPLWLICLRIISSENCIKFETKSKTKISEIINKTAKEEITKYFKKSNQSKTPIKFYWLNLLISNPPQDINDNDIKMIHDFLDLLSLDDLDNKSMKIQEMKNEYIYNSVKDIVISVLSNQAHDLIQRRISENSPVIRFLAQPSKYFRDKIDQKIIDEAKKILDNKSVSNLRDILANKDYFSRIIKKLKIAIEEDESEYQNYHKDIKKKEHNDQRNKRIENLQNKINEYNQIVDDYLKSKIKVNERSEKIQKLLDLEKNLKYYPELFKNYGFDITYISTEGPIEYYCNDKHRVKRIHLNNDNHLHIFRYLLPYHSIHPKDNPGAEIGKIQFKYIKEIYANSSSEVANLFQNDFELSYEKPVLTFGKYYKKSNDFVKNVESLYNKLSSFGSKFFDILQYNQTINYSIFSFVKDNLDLSDEIGKNLQVQFSDNHTASKTKLIIEDLNQYFQILHPLLDETNQILNTKLYIIWKELDIKQQIGKLFKYEYDIFDITKININPSIIPDFSKINTIKSLASPIFSRSPANNEIICSVKKLKCQIGPIFPALFSNRPISINLISFIDSETTTSFENLDPQFSQILSTKEKLSKNEPVQLFIIPPEITEKKDEILSMTGNLKIDVLGNNSFLLPFDITLALLPLKVRLRCIQHQLSEIKDNYFRLCCTEINSGGIIDFELINYYIHDQFILAVELESLEENQADQPIKKIEKTKKIISIILPSVRETTRCQFNVIIKISQNIEIKILCDFLIRPFVFVFQMYDFLKQEFTSDSCQIISKKGLNHKLYFRILANYPLKQQGKVTELYFPFSIKIQKSDLYKNDKFDFDGSYTFSIYINNEKGYETSHNSYDYKIEIEIGNTKKHIKFVFINPENIPFYPNITDEKTVSKNNYFLKIFPCYCYINNVKGWKRMKDYKDIPSIDDKSLVPILMTTPFKSYSDQSRFTEINYHLNDRKYVSVSYSKKFDIEYIKVTLNYEKDDEIFTISSLSDVSSYTRYEHRKYIPDKKINMSYFSIIGYDKNDKNCWFPTFDEYPYIEHKNKLPYSNDKDNIEKAENNITEMFKTLKSNTKEIIPAFEKEKPYISQTNFAILITFLLDKDAILKIPLIIQKFPPIIQDKFKDIMQEIDPYISQSQSLDDGIKFIISHNIILKFIEVFNERYLDIKSRGFCLQMPIKDEDIDKQVKASLNELMHYDSSFAKNINIDFNSLITDKGSASNSPDSIPDSIKSYCFIISENDDPKPCDINNLGSFIFNESDSEDLTISDSTDTLSSLPSINIPSHDSIEAYNLFFSECSQATSILPTYIKNIKSKNLDIKESEEYFAKLANIYIEVTKSSTSNMSILSNSINRFISSFKNCVKILKKAGAIFDKMKLPQSLNGSSGYYQDFIWIPIIETPTFSHIVWKNKNKVSLYANDDYNIDFTPINVEKYDAILVDDAQFGPNDQPNQPIKTIKPIQSPNRPINGPVITPIVFDDDADEDDGTDNNNNDAEEEEEDSDSNRQEYHAESPDIHGTTDVKNDDYKTICNNINEIDILKYVIKLIIKMKENKGAEIELTENIDNSNYTIQNQDELFDTSIKDFPVKDLVDNSQYLTMKLISCLSESSCPFLSISCNLLIDCSKTISKECKLYNFMFLISFSFALSSLEIPFTISIIADQNFRFVMKNYEDDISLKVLQRILDCLFIERYRANIADTFYHSLYLLKHPSRTQRALFIFTDGIDENLVLTESWKKQILNDSNNSFGLIFSESKHPPEINFDVIKNMWDDFNKSVENAVSKTKLTYVNPDISPNTFEAISKNFVEVLSRPPINVSNQSEQYLKPVFNSNYKELTEESYLKIKRSIKYNFGEFQSSIFKKTNQINKIQGIRFEKIDISHFRNKTAKINSSSVKKEIKDDFDHLIRNNLLSKMNSSRAQLETIFKPNKASQTVLSSTGTDFDITALILNLINPVPDPLIYLEEKGGLIRNYGVSIVIDSSNSCFNQFSALHSFQTIKVLFSALASIDIPCVDVIIATEESPIVLKIIKNL